MEIFEANEMEFRVADARVAERIEDGEEKGSADEQHNIERRGGEHSSA